ncbi:MAG: nitroreductase family protein [Candidatus Omnitrophica bacterium]|nr:nitroreductase family protein [Candidatus Omnitrophota bacterium]MCM8791289.1 nitroreductase family protein [Candidatus Omnitrophota bacterium]
MSFLRVDITECASCGTCVEVCPVRILELDAEKRPRVREGREDDCISCGHCACACPKGAISLDFMPIEKLKELPAGWRLTPEKAEVFFKGRRSIRVYKDEMVDKAVIDKMIDIARYAPTGINRQEVHWAVIHDPNKVKELAGLTVEWMKGLVAEKSPLAESLHFEGIIKAFESGSDRICRGAPHTVITYAPKADRMAVTDCVIAMAHFELIALPFGLGACWAGYLKMALNEYTAARKAAGISSKAECHGAMLLGYPKYEYNCIPLRVEPRIIWR